MKNNKNKSLQKKEREKRKRVRNLFFKKEEEYREKNHWGHPKNHWKK